MASVYMLLENYDAICRELQLLFDHSEIVKRCKYRAAIVIQRHVRGFLIKRYIKLLNNSAIVIQRHFRGYIGRIAYYKRLKEAIKDLYRRHYDKKATIIQKIWRGYWSREHIFSYYRFAKWLRDIEAKNDEMVKECDKFKEETKNMKLDVLEAEAKQWIVYILFKLHHLIRTISIKGIYSNRTSVEFTEFEKMLRMIKYKSYIKQLKTTYDNYIKSHRVTCKPSCTCQGIFPMIGSGEGYWYLQLSDLDELTKPNVPPKETRGRLHHYDGEIHKQPFRWRRLRSPPLPKSINEGPHISDRVLAENVNRNDNYVGMLQPKFHRFVQHHKFDKSVVNYIDLQVNALLKLKCYINKELDNLK